MATVLGTLFDSIVLPEASFARLAPRRMLLWLFIVFVATFLCGSILQRPALHNVEYQRMLAQFGGGDALSASSLAQIASVTLHKPLSADLAQWLIQLTFFMVGLLLAAFGVYSLAMMLGGRAQFSYALAGVLLVAIPSIGLYQITAGVAVALIGPSSFNTYDSLAHIVPSLGSLLHTGNGFWNGFLASVNPFTVWAVVLYSYLFRDTIGLKGRAPLFCALVMTIGGCALQGLLGAIST